IVKLIYRHRHSGPGYRSKFYTERDLMFSGAQIPSELRYARPAISCWAIQLVGDHVHHQVAALTVDEEDEWADEDETATNIEASVSGRRDVRPMATWGVMEQFSIKNIANMLQRRAGSVWYLTERMAGPEKHGKVIVRKRRPHSTIQVAAITSFVMSRNRFANGYLAFPLGIWLFACRAHIDIKRALSRMGLSISDTTVRTALAAMSDAGRAELQKSVGEHAARGELGWRIIMDNVQGYALVREGQHGKQSVLKVGTAATAVRLYDCPPDAFKLQPYLDSIIENKRSELTTDRLLDSLDFPHINRVLALHWVRSLLDYLEPLHPLKPELAALFRSPPIAINRLPSDRKTEIQPLGSNAEREIELDGSHACVRDFDAQSGWLEKFAEFLVSWYGGDGGTYAALKRLKKLLAATAPKEYASFMHMVVTPELWHMGSTMVGTLATNHFGPASSADPSSLSRASTAASQKRPSDLSKPDYYPTVRGMKLIWNAQVLDCWRLHFCPDTPLPEYFAVLASKNELPSLDALIRDAETLQQRYGTLDAYERVLSHKDWEDTDIARQIPKGSPWTHSAPTATQSETNEQEDEAPGEPDEESSPPKSSKSKIPTHVEADGFDGDRCAANAILFKFEFGLWIEFSYAVSDGDIGRAWEIIKSWIFLFGGSTNTNYMNYLLDTYCLLTYDAPEPLRVAIFANWLANLAAQLGHHIPLDLMQEHHNHIIEELVEKMGKDFDDDFYRRVIAPNVHRIIQAKDGIEDGFDIARRGNSHTSPDYWNEIESLLRLFLEEELHLFRTGCSLGHAAANLLNGGYIRLDSGKMEEFVEEGTEYADFL
ncbi:hypothetical protein BDZ89DRAFT_926566, partial [Hymenopellis radicata]